MTRGTAWTAALALTIVLAAACAEEGVRPVEAGISADSADQVLIGMTTTATTDGIKRSVISAETAYVYQDRQTHDLRTLVITFFDATGAGTSSVTARTGTYDVQQGSFNARGNVEWRSHDGTRILRTEQLRYDKLANEISSDTAFTFQSPSELLRGSSFRSDTEFRNIVTRQPTGRQVGGGMILPGQR